MSSYLNNLLTNTTSRYNNLRRQILSDETDGDTEDDSHLSRVLRAYYTEKGRPFPQWLPPDPKAPQPAAPTQFASSSSLRQQGQAPMGRGGGGGGGGGLSDLWDNPAPQQQAQEPLSLRRAAGGRPMQGRPMGNSLTPEPQIQGRPLPSQRAGSYQSSLGGRPQSDSSSPPPSAGGGTSAQERLKARLWGRSQSPAQSGNASPSSLRSTHEQGGRAPYQEERNNGYAGGQQGSFGMSANSPWTGNADPYAPQGGGYGGSAPPRGPQGGRMGLPSGPRMR
ncbi:hypothetical protein yc1106_07863 [Curvularia clavata]|uniref:Mso1 N-terminal domain-containing protein n=1 Tax=Curvularia clavata TaxID=95742 RepID=A0A9Q9DW70_CURCL|nr:hypothetical protein yc1106_07863 [Curvularia clavata]